MGIIVFDIAAQILRMGFGDNAKPFASPTSKLTLLFPLRASSLWLGARLNNKALLAMQERLVFVGVAGFEPTTSCSQSRRDTGLRYTPNWYLCFHFREGIAK
jgi:hypothetical protein